MDFTDDTPSDDATGDGVATDGATATVDDADGFEVPPPEMATPDDVERYNLEFAKANGTVPEFRSRPGTAEDGEAAFAKQDDSELARNTKHRAEFPWLSEPSRGVRWDFDPIALRNLAQTNTWVGMLVQSITKEIAETPWTIVAAEGRTETQKRLATHPDERTPVAKADDTDELPDATAERIHDLLLRPNPDLTWQDMVEQWMADLLEIGSTATVKAFHRSAYGGEDGDEFVADPSTVEPRALQPTAPEVWTKDYHARTGLVDGYWQFDDHRSPGSGSVEDTSVGFRGSGSPDFFDTAEVIWSDMSPRTNRRYGIPPTLLVEDFLQSLDLAVTQEQQYLSRGSIPSGAWVFEQWDREQLRERRQVMEENVKGKPHKSLMFAGQGGDVSFEPMSMNFQELEFTERMKWYARVVASAFQVPTAVVGIEPERVNYATFQGERENFESNTLGPYLQKLERLINHDFIHPHWGVGSYRFEFKPGMSESTRAMISERVTREFSAGIRRRNEARREIGLGEVNEEFDGFQDEVVADTSAEDAEDALGELVAGRIDDDTDDKETAQSHDGETGNGHGGTVTKDEALRETDAWYQFDVQPHMVESLRDAIADDVQALFDRVTEDAEVRRLIERLAGDETEKSLASLTRRLEEIFDESDVAARISRALREETASATRETIEETLAEASDAPVETDVDVEAIEERLADRDVRFADRFADELRETIRDTVGDGWAEGKGTREIAEDIADQADIESGWSGAERIARQELHIATGEARSEVAADLDKVEVWQTSEDDRVRPAHEQMQGTWKHPGDEWSVDYSTEGRGVQKESVPGDSEPGIGCRCTTLLRDRDTVEQSEYAGV
jgi:phage portal protein BeeE